MTLTKQQYSTKNIPYMQNTDMDLTQLIFSFFSRFYHDAAAPVRHIGFYMDLLAEAIAEQDQEKSLQLQKKAKQQAEQLQQFIRAAKRYCQYILPPVEQQTVHLLACIKREIDQLQHDYAHKHITFKVSTDIQLTVNGKYFAGLLHELLDNAVKFSNDNVMLDIMVEQQHDSVKLQIKDQGMGIAAGGLPKVGLPFMPLHTQDIPGIGLGLSICHLLCQHLHGSELQLIPNQPTGINATLILKNAIRAQEIIEHG